MNEIKWNFIRRSTSIGSTARRRKIYDVGINDAWYITAPTINDRTVFCPAYRTWLNMLKRCYNLNSQCSRPTYIGTTVCDEWLKFSNFLKWFDDNYVEGYQLDKDIFGTGKLYSPETCIFIPLWLNSFILDHGTKRGEYPIGVYLERKSKKFKAQCSNPITNKHEHLGRFETCDLAHQTWLNKKLEHCLTMKSELDNIDSRLYDAVTNKIKELK